MDKIVLLELAVNELRDVVISLQDSDLETPSNCDPWTVRGLASHALNNQLLWGGVVTGRDVVSLEDTMGAVPHEGDLSTFAGDSVERALSMWREAGVLDATHTTPFGELPGSVVIDFPTIDALAHAWDLSASVGRPIEFSRGAMPAISALVDRTCTDDIRALGLIASAVEAAPEATGTDRLMALAGRSAPH